MWSEAKSAGCALAALIADDRALSRVSRGLDARALASARAQLAPDPAGGGSQARRQLVARLLSSLRPELEPARLPPRLAHLLASELPQVEARALRARTPAPRPGYRVAAELWPRLRRIARRSIAAGGTMP